MCLEPHNIACVKIVKVITDNDYFYNVIDYDYEYFASGNADYDCVYDYLRSYKLIPSITITVYD